MLYVILPLFLLSLSLLWLFLSFCFLSGFCAQDEDDGDEGVRCCWLNGSSLLCVSRFRICVRLVCLPWFCFSSFAPSHPLYFLVFSFVPPCSLFLFSLCSSLFSVFIFVPSASLPFMYCVCSVLALRSPSIFFFFSFFFFKKTLPIARECHAVTQIIKSLWDCYCRSLKFYRR